MDLLRSIGLEQVEELTVDLLEFIQHGDLHGENVLANPNGEPFLVDFGRTRVYVGPLDPVLLELSLVLHPSSNMRDVLSEHQCRLWVSESYADGTALAPLVHACRELAAGAGHDQRAIAAVGWVQAIRHLKWPHTSKERALAIAEACAQELLRTA
jgi:hypothetical protein